MQIATTARVPVSPRAAGGASVFVEGVSKRFGAIEALRNVGVEVAPGELLVITGPIRFWEERIVEPDRWVGSARQWPRFDRSRGGLEASDIVSARREPVGFVFSCICCWAS